MGATGEREIAKFAEKVKGVLFAGLVMCLWIGVSQTAFAGLQDGADAGKFTEYADKAISVFRYIGIFVVAGLLINAGIKYGQGDSHETKDILAKALVAAVIVIIGPTLISFVVRNVVGSITF